MQYVWSVQLTCMCTYLLYHQSFQNDVDALLEEAKEKDELTYKVLLLGAGEAGKSTVVKQLKMIYKVCHLLCFA